MSGTTAKERAKWRESMEVWASLAEASESESSDKDELFSEIALWKGRAATLIQALTRTCNDLDGKGGTMTLEEAWAAIQELPFVATNGTAHYIHPGKLEAAAKAAMLAVLEEVDRTMTSDYLPTNYERARQLKARIEALA